MTIHKVGNKSGKSLRFGLSVGSRIIAPSDIIQTPQTAKLRRGLGINVQAPSDGGGDIKTTLQSRLILGYSGDSLSSDMGYLRGYLTTATVQSTQKKIGSNALSFNGNQNAALEIRLNKFFRNSQKFSIGCWVYFNSFNFAGPWGSFYTSGFESVSQMAYFNNTGASPARPAFRLLSGSTNYDAVGSSGDWAINTWHHTLCEVDVTGLKSRLFVDNVLLDEITLPSGFVLNEGTANESAFGLGGYYIGFAGVSNLNGFIDEFIILAGNTTQDERDWLWNGGTGNSLT